MGNKKNAKKSNPNGIKWKTVWPPMEGVWRRNIKDKTRYQDSRSERRPGGTKIVVPRHRKEIKNSGVPFYEMRMPEDERLDTFMERLEAAKEKLQAQEIEVEEDRDCLGKLIQTIRNIPR